MYDITAIKNYILYLKKECGLLISLHIGGMDHIIIPSELISFNIHENSYCIYIKNCEQAQNHCIAKQAAIIEKCAQGSFCGICHAGVKEYVYPIINREQTIGFISVSGYQCENHHEYLYAIATKYGFPEAELFAAYGALRKEIPNKQWVDTLIQPLCDMLSLAYLKTENNENQEQSFCDQMVRYLKKNHNQNISSTDICRHFNCSRSHISHKFNEKMGISIKQYINQLRIEDAKNMLLYSELTVTEIAFSVGFSDSNYFTGIFKKQTGFTPSAFRKNFIQNQNAKHR